MPPKNILILGNYPPPYGGIPHHLFNLAPYLAAHGWNCHILSGGTTGYETKDGISIYKPTRLRKAVGLARRGLDQEYSRWLDGGDLPASEPNFWRRYKIYADVGAEIVRRNDISIVASYNLLTYAPIGTWLSQRFDIPHVISNFGEVFKFESMRRNKAFFRHVAESAAVRISCSDHCGRSLAALGIEAPVLDIPHGIDSEHFRPGDDPTELRRVHGFGNGPVVLFIGRLSEEMGLGSFLTAAEQLRDYPGLRFVMVGQDGDLADQAEQKCRASDGIMALVRNVPHEMLPLYYRLARVVAVPTHGDRTCSSLAAMEAMATRTPVVAFAIGGIPEIVRHEETGLLVPPEDASGLADGLRRMLDDSQLREKVIENGYHLVKKRLDVTHCNIAMERQFLQALGSP